MFQMVPRFPVKPRAKTIRAEASVKVHKKACFVDFLLKEGHVEQSKLRDGFE